MRFRFELLNEEQAGAITGWRYPPPYDFYNGSGDPDGLGELLDRGSPYYAAMDPQGALLGFFCFGQTAQAPAGILAGVYDDPAALDLGLGLRPDLAGRGLGFGFVQSGLNFAREVFALPSFRLTVATFNQRAVAIYERAGFRSTRTFINRAKGGEREFLVMARPAVVESQIAHALH